MRRLSLLGFALLLAAAGPEKKEGMPQLNFANPLTISQVIWGAIIFALMYFLLARWALPMVGTVVEGRRSTVADDLNTARQAKSEADRAVADLLESTRVARANAQAEIAAATAAAKADAATRTAETNAKLDAQLAEAEARIEQARSSAMGALRQVASDAAGAVLIRLTGHAADPSAIDTAVGRLLPAGSGA